MKKILFSLLLFSASIMTRAQTLDTVMVRNLSLQAQDWAWLVGANATQINYDSASSATFRRIRDKIRTANPASWTVSVTIDSLPGKYVLAFYRQVKTGNSGEIASRYSAITTAISAKTNLSPWINAFDQAVLDDYNRRREVGRYIIMDN